MGSIPVLDELAIITVLGVLVTLVVSKLRLPTVAGLLLAGALLGPYGLRLVDSVHAIDVLSEVGVVMLLFSIGLEFSLNRLRHIIRHVLVGGGLQVGLSTLAAMGVARFAGLPWPTSIFYGFVFALSSTAIVLKALIERRELSAPHGQFIVGTLIFQDLCVVPMMLIVPLLGSAGNMGELAGQVGLAVAKAVVLVAITVFMARYVVPHVLKWVSNSGSREVFLLAVLALCIGTAWASEEAGLSVALGAFLGGMVVAGTEYGHRAMGDILPLRDAFLSIFFVSLGMMFDMQTVLQAPWLVFALVVGFLLGKALLATFAAMAMGFPARVALLAGVGVAQFGEFGFVLSKIGQENGVIDEGHFAPVLAAGIISMFLTPLLMRLAPHFTAGEKLLAPLQKLFGVSSIDEAADVENASFADHVILVGYGVMGRLQARALEASRIPYVILEINVETVRLARAEKEAIYYADATSEEALGHAHLQEARALVIMINDPAAALRVVDTAKRIAPNVPIFVRCRYLAERKLFLNQGASEVVTEEIEAGLEMLARVLRHLETPRNIIEQQIESAREQIQVSERRLTLPRRTLGEHHNLAALKIESVLIEQGCVAVGQSPVALEVRGRTQALVVAIRRNGELMELDPHGPFMAGDVVYLVGSSPAVKQAVGLLSR